jgi:hypothetical protein
MKSKGFFFSKEPKLCQRKKERQKGRKKKEEGRKEQQRGTTNKTKKEKEEKKQLRKGFGIQLFEILVRSIFLIPSDDLLQLG